MPQFVEARTLPETKADRGRSETLIEGKIRALNDEAMSDASAFGLAPPKQQNVD